MSLDRLQAVAAQLAARVRDEDPQANARWLMATLPDPADRFALHFVQAEATPIDQPWSELIAWTRGDQTRAAYLAGRRDAATAIRAGMCATNGMPRALTGQSPRGGRPSISSYAEWAARLAEGSAVAPDPDRRNYRREYWRDYHQRRKARAEAKSA